jgi:hypothetical protein
MELAVGLMLIFLSAEGETVPGAHANCAVADHEGAHTKLLQYMS